jgi:hypothetical protein
VLHLALLPAEADNASANGRLTPAVRDAETTVPVTSETGTLINADRP